MTRLDPAVRASPAIRVRPARPGEEAALTALCRRSKAHWGYDADFMRQAAPALTVATATIDEGHVLVGEDFDGRALGAAAIQKTETEGLFELALLFVEPSAIGIGVGRVLFCASARLAASRGGTWLSILADPFAAGFYRRLGAADIGEAPSELIAGRLLPLFRYTIPRSP